MDSAALPLITKPAKGKLRQHRRQRLGLVLMVFSSYLVDFVLLLILSLNGGIELFTACAYLGAGTVVSAFFYALLSTTWSERFQDHYLTGPQMLVHACVILGFTLHAPQIGMLLLMLIFLQFAFGSFGVNPRRLLSGPIPAAICVAIGVVVVMVLVGDRMRLPMANWQQRTVSGVWVIIILARSTLVGLYSAQLRVLLAKRNGELADTFVKLEQMASHDELTGVLNRRSLMLLLEEERQRMQRTKQVFGVVLFDIDHFKRVNDGFGHLVGDEALRHFARVGMRCMRNTDRLGRYGGEEFLMLLTATADTASARTAAERVRAGTAEHDWEAVAPGLKVTVSAGVALCEPDESIEHLLDRADHALYAAKREGRNCVQLG